jgi:hypothetical protein
MNYKTYKSLQSQKERLLNEIADRVADVLAEDYSDINEISANTKRLAYKKSSRMAKDSSNMVKQSKEQGRKDKFLQMSPKTDQFGKKLLSHILRSKEASDSKFYYGLEPETRTEVRNKFYTASEIKNLPNILEGKMHLVRSRDKAEAYKIQIISKNFAYIIDGDGDVKEVFVSNDLSKLLNKDRKVQNTLDQLIKSVMVNEPFLDVSDN